MSLWLRDNHHKAPQHPNPDIPLRLSRMPQNQRLFFLNGSIYPEEFFHSEPFSEVIFNYVYLLEH